MQQLADECLLVWIKGDEAHTEELIRRFDKAPKPMAYQPEFLARAWADYLAEKNITEDTVNPDDFIRWTYAAALSHRQPRYAAMSKWGVTITPADIDALNAPEDFTDLIARHLPSGG